MQPTTYQTPRRCPTIYQDPSTISDDLPKLPTTSEDLLKLFDDPRRPTKLGDDLPSWRREGRKRAQGGRSQQPWRGKEASACSLDRSLSSSVAPAIPHLVCPPHMPRSPDPTLPQIHHTPPHHSVHRHPRSLTVHNFRMIVGTAISVRVTMSCPRNCPASTVYQQHHQQSSSRRPW